MRRTSLNKFYFFITILLFSVIFFSCNTTKKVKYFQDIPDSGALKTIPKADYTEPAIQVDDILTILVETVDPTATAMINLGNVPISSTGSSSSSSSLLGQQSSSGYLVNKQGNIEVPVLGTIHVLGYTTSQVRDTIRVEALKYFKEPTVIVRYANFKISITGEVLKPGQYVMPNEKVSVLDALAMAGDLTIFGKRNNVLLIRENVDGTKTPYRIDLTKSDIMSAPYYYLKQNDVIYVEPRKSKSDATDASQTKYITLASALLSILIIIAYRVK